jgi:type IV pilus assembly protein PilM
MFFRKKCLGIDIGTTTVKVVVLSFGNKQPKLESYGILENYAHLERVNEAIQTSNFKLVEKTTAKYLGDLLKKSNIRTRDAIFSIPCFNTYTNILEFPPLSQKDLERAVYFQAKQYVPMSLSEVSIDWQIVYQDNTKTKVLLVAVPKEFVNRYLSIAKMTNIRIIKMELESLASARSLIGNERGVVSIVDVGGRSTTVSIFDNGVLQSMKTMDIAGGDLTQVISTGLNIIPVRAEEIKRLYGLKPPIGQEEVMKLMLPLLGVIEQEMQREFSFFSKKTNKNIEKIYLTGGIANLPGITGYVSNDFKVPVFEGNPFELGIIKFDKKLEPVIKEIGSSLSVACGLLMK